MNFDLTERQRHLVELASGVVRDHCSFEDESGRDRSGEFPRELFSAMGEAGLFRLLGNGDLGGSFLEASLVQETLAFRSATASSILFVNSAAVAMMTRGGVQPAARHVLTGAASGRLAFSFAMTEPQAGSDASAIATTAAEDGSEFVLQGHKLYATGAGEADYLLVVARTRADGSARSGSSLVLVARDAPGMTIRKLEKVAGDAHGTCEVFFEAVRVPRDHVVGSLDGAWSLLGFGSQVERLLVAAMSIGFARRALTEVKAVLSQRTQFAQPITEFQAVRHRLADMATELEAMRWMTWRAAWLADQGRDCTSEINMAKLFAAETGARICAEAMRLAGGRSYFLGDVLNRTWRESTLSLFAGGTSEIQRNGIAKGMGL